MMHSRGCTASHGRQKSSPKDSDRMASQPQTVGQNTEQRTPQQTGITRGHWATVVVVSAAISVIAVLIGTYKFQIGPAALVLLPIVWAVIMGGIVGTQRVRR